MPSDDLSPALPPLGPPGRCRGVARGLMSHARRRRQRRALGQPESGAPVGDDPAAVAENRARLAAALGAQPVWLQPGARQRRVTRWTAARRRRAATGRRRLDRRARHCRARCWWPTACRCCLRAATAARSRPPMPAGAVWPAGVLEAHRAGLVRGRRCAGDVLAWLGPCIGRDAFEVGADVLRRLRPAPDSADPPRFASPARRRQRCAGWPTCRAWRGDRLRAPGVREIHGGRWCTVQDRQASSRSAATGSAGACRCRDRARRLMPRPGGARGAGRRGHRCTARCPAAARRTAAG